jgi:AraC-like DNA-binding protein
VLTPLCAVPGVRVGYYACRAHRHAPAVEEASPGHSIGFVRRGFFVKQVGRARAAADATHAVLFPRDEVYRIHHPIDGGDECLVLDLDDEVVAALMAECGDPASAEAKRLPSGHARLDAAHQLLLSRLAARARRDEDVVAIEESACRVAAAAVAGARTGRQARPRPGADRDDRIRAVQATMSRRLGDRLTLTGLAASVEWSPFQLLRAFRAATGAPVHRYLTELRVAAAVARLADGEADLTRLALECGFADHSHFANVFRRHARLTPSAARTFVTRSRASR